MKHLNLWMVALFCMFAGMFAACSEKDTEMPAPTLEISSTALELEAVMADKAAEVTIKSNYDWTATCPAQDTAWLNLEQKEDKLLITAEVNTDTVVRKSKITITAGYEERMEVGYIEVSQKAGEPTKLALSAKSVEFQAAGGDRQVEALANTETLNWSFVENTEETPAVAPGEWCNVQIEGAVIKITALENAAEESRSCQLLITAGAEGNQQSATIDVVQRGNAPYVEFVDVPDTLYMDGLTDVLELEVSANTEWNYYPFGTVDLSSAIEKQDDKLVVTVPGWFSTTEEGYNKISLECKTFDGSEWLYNVDYVVLKWSKADKVQMAIDPTELYVDKNGGDYEVTVDANYAWVLGESSDSWLTVKKSDDGKKVLVNATASTEENTREASFMVKVGDGNNKIEKTVKVFQYGTKPLLALSTDMLLLSGKGDTQEVTVNSNIKWNISFDEQPSWLTYTQEGNVLKFTVGETDETRSCKMLIYSNEMDPNTGLPMEAVLTITQNKIYQVGDPYIVNGETVGIVFSVTDGGAHGKVLSLKDATDQYGQSGTLYCDLYYIGVTDYESWLKDPNNHVATTRTNGLENLKMYQSRYPDWAQRYPMLGWCSKLKEETGVEWYIPAIEEWGEFYAYAMEGKYELNYEGSWSIPDSQQDPEGHAAAVACFEKFNLKLQELGGDPLVDDGYHSSTEEFDEGIIERPSVTMPRGWVGYSDIYGWGSTSPTRAMCRF